MVGANEITGVSQMRVRGAKILSEVQKIRFEVMDLIYRHGKQSVMIPSSNELAARFGVARSTARLALEKMIDEGYLVTRRGIGTFTMPGACTNVADMPLIGVRIGSGDQFYYDAPLLHELGCLFTALSARHCNIRLLTESGNTVEEFAGVLDHAHVDAMIAISVPAELSQLAAQRFPVVSVGFPAEGVNSIVYGGQAVIKKLASLTGHGKKLSVLSVSHTDDLTELFSAMRQHPGMDFTGLYGKQDSPAFTDRIRRSLDSNPPDLIMLRLGMLPQIRRLLEGLELSRHCRLLCLDASSPHSVATDFRLEAPLQETIGMAVDEVLAILAGRPDSHFRRVIDYRIIERSQTEILASAD